MPSFRNIRHVAMSLVTGVLVMGCAASTTQPATIVPSAAALSMRPMPSAPATSASVQPVGGPVPSPAGTPVPSPAGSPGIGPALSPAASPTTDPRHADPDLERMLPDTLHGSLLKRESQSATSLLRQSDALDAMLGRLGRTKADMTIASAYDPGGTLAAEVGAWRIAGADPTRILAEFVATVQASSTTPITVAQEQLGLRAVTRIGDPGQLTRGPLYAYALGDRVFFVQTPDPALAAEAIAELPAD